MFGRVRPQICVAGIPEVEVGDMRGSVPEISLNEPSQRRRKLIVDEKLHAESSTG